MEIVEEIEEAWDEGHLVESDKSWDAMHRCLTDGTLTLDSGQYPLNKCILGGHQLHEGEQYIVSLVTAAEAHDVAEALGSLTKEWFHEKYYGVVPRDYAPEYGDEDFEYTWSYFEEMKAFYQKAASNGRAVLFTVDQ